MPESSPQRSKPTPAGKAFIPTGRNFFPKEDAQKYFPMVDLVDENTGEVFKIYQYKIVFNWQLKFAKDPDKPYYHFPDFMVVQEYYRLHGKWNSTKSFTDMLRMVILRREHRCESIIVYDNTKMIPGNVMYQSILDHVTGKLEIEINYLFPNRPNYRIHPRYPKKP